MAYSRGKRVRYTVKRKPSLSVLRARAPRIQTILKNGQRFTGRLTGIGMNPLTGRRFGWDR